MLSNRRARSPSNDLYMRSPSPKRTSPSSPLPLQQQYAPTFLMGSARAQQSADTSMRASRGRTPFSPMTPMDFSRDAERSHHGESSFAAKDDDRRFTSIRTFPTNNSHRDSPAKPTGPPVRSLMTDVDLNASRMSRLPYLGGGADGSNRSFMNSSLNASRAVHETLESSHIVDKPAMDSSRVDRFYTQGPDFDPQEHTHECCITIYGFTQADSEYILKEFRQYGTVLTHEMPAGCNFMHVMYQNSTQADLARAKNTKRLRGGTLQVGVTQCIEKDVVDRFRLRYSDSVTDASSPSIVDSSFASPTFFSPAPPHHASPTKAPPPLHHLNVVSHDPIARLQRSHLQRSASLRQPGEVSRRQETVRRLGSGNEESHSTGSQADGNYFSKALNMFGLR